MNPLKPLRLLTVILLIAGFTSGCLENYGKIRLAPGDPNVTLQDLKDNWENYDILYAGLATDSPSALMFGPRSDGKRLIGKKWMPRNRPVRGG